MNKVKFLDYPEDEVANLEVHEENAAGLVVNEIQIMMCDWGFPPEIEAVNEVSKRDEIPRCI
jgi:hypothetical protein